MSDSTNYDSTSLYVRPQDVVSPTLDSSSFGHYRETLVWSIDTTTLLPVGMTHFISLDTSAAGVL